MAGKKQKPRKTKSKKLSLKAGFLILVVLALWSWAGEWYVHHSRSWLQQHHASWPSLVTDALLLLGNPVADITDGLGWTGHDAVYEYDTEAPSGSVAFAGLPVRTGLPAPNDIKVLDRGPFIVGWSPSLRHPAWVAYHVLKEKRFNDGSRPSFMLDKSASSCPRPEDYKKSGYDRGHMAPNHAIISRFGEDARRRTFQMSNIAPQRPALNRAVWRDLEHRIAELWTARYGEIWVVVGSIPSSCALRIGPGIDVPDSFYMVIIAQEGMNVRALAVLLPNECQWDAWAARGIISIDELETLTGLDFNPELPGFIQDPLEAELPSRLWPVNTFDVISQFLSRYSS